MSENIVGPFGAGVNETTTRPADVDAGSATDTWFQDCVNGTPGTGTKVPANWLNKVSALIRRATRGMGIPDESTDDDLLLKAIQKAQRGVESEGDTGAGIVDIQDGINTTTNNIKIRKIRGVGLTFSIDPETGELVATLGGGAVSLATIAPVFSIQEQRAGNAAPYQVGTVWTTRLLNTTLVNQISGASCTAGNIALPAGTYRFDFAANANNAFNHQIRLYDVTHGVLLGLGTDSDCHGSTEPTAPSMGHGYFTLPSGGATIQMQHIKRGSAGTVLAGDDTPIGSDTHVDAYLTLVKEA